MTFDASQRQLFDYILQLVMYSYSKTGQPIPSVEQITTEAVVLHLDFLSKLAGRQSPSAPTSIPVVWPNGEPV